MPNRKKANERVLLEWEYDPFRTLKGEIETLLVDVRQDPVQFWTLLKSKCDVELDQLGAQAKSQQAFGRR